MEKFKSILLILSITLFIGTFVFTQSCKNQGKIIVAEPEQLVSIEMESDSTFYVSWFNYSENEYGPWVELPMGLSTERFFVDGLILFSVRAPHTDVFFTVTNYYDHSLIKQGVVPAGSVSLVTIEKPKKE